MITHSTCMYDHSFIFHAWHELACMVNHGTSILTRSLNLALRPLSRLPATRESRGACCPQQETHDQHGAPGEVLAVTWPCSALCPHVCCATREDTAGPRCSLPTLWVQQKPQVCCTTSIHGSQGVLRHHAHGRCPQARCRRHGRVLTTFERTSKCTADKHPCTPIPAAPTPPPPPAPSRHVQARKLEV